jgi:hypothetical protein
VSKADRKTLRDKFLAWQCRLRQAAMRVDGGRPSSGMRPKLLDEKRAVLTPALTVLLMPKEPAESTAFFRFQVMKSADPQEIYARALTYLQADYFQSPEAFSDTLLAVLPNDSPVAAALLGMKRCSLSFAEGAFGYSVPCKVSVLEPGHAAREAAIWHNRVFNAALPESVHVVAFRPDWASARAEPGREGRDSVSL